MSFSSAVRPLAALALTVVAVEEMLSAATPNLPGRERLISTFAPRAVPSFAHLLALVAGLVLLALVPSLWRGTRLALLLAATLLGLLAVINLVKGLDYEETILDASLALLLLLARGAFALGSQARRRLTIAIALVGIWASAYVVLLIGLLSSSHARTIGEAVRNSVGSNAILASPWAWAVDGLVIVGVVVSLLLIRSLLKPARGVDGHSESDHVRARDVVAAHGHDSLAPFILREDKALHFHAGGVLAYRVLAETAVISGDPVAPAGGAPRVLASFMEMACERGWQVVLWGASERHLGRYRELGLRHLHIGNEAFVDPAEFTTDGRRMRKVRQSVHRIERRGWTVDALSGRELDDRLLGEITGLERAWRAQQRRVIGFAMGMGPWEAEQQPADLYLMGRTPEGELRAVMRFIDHRGGLSLDTMCRVGDTPNGLNEALVVRALELARGRGVREVSLNFAGFAHLMAAEAAELEAHRRVARFLLGLLGERFQMERLVRFNDKFLPHWRPRFLVYDSRTRLPRGGLRVLQAEAYLRGPKPTPLARRWRPQRPPFGVPPRVSGAG